MLPKENRDMRVGDMVRNSKEQRLYCGCGMYPYAIVMSLDPFILVSEETDMRWDHVLREEMDEIVGRAKTSTILRCLCRLSLKEKIKFLNWSK
jgi:hypothetical protein